MNKRRAIMYRGFKIFLCTSFIFIFFGAIPTYAHYEVVTKISKDGVTASLGTITILDTRPYDPPQAKIFSAQEMGEYPWQWWSASRLRSLGYDDDFFEENFLVIHSMYFSYEMNELSITSFDVDDFSISVNVSEYRILFADHPATRFLLVEIPLSMAHKDILITDRLICWSPMPQCVIKAENCLLCENCDYKDRPRQQQCIAETPCPHHTGGDSSDLVRIQVVLLSTTNREEGAEVQERFIRRLNEMLTEAGFEETELFATNSILRPWHRGVHIRVPEFLLNSILTIPEVETWAYAADICRIAKPATTEENCSFCVDCDAPLPRICADDEPCANHFVVPQTGVGDVTVYVAAMFAFFAVAVGLWGRLFFTGAER